MLVILPRWSDHRSGRRTRHRQHRRRQGRRACRCTDRIAQPDRGPRQSARGDQTL